MDVSVEYDTSRFDAIIVSFISQLNDDEFLSFNSDQWKNFYDREERKNNLGRTGRSISARLPLRPPANANANGDPRPKRGGGVINDLDTRERANLYFKHMCCCFKRCKFMWNESSKSEYRVMTNPLFSTCVPNPLYDDGESESKSTYPIPELPTDITGPMIQQFVNDVFVKHSEEITRRATRWVFRDNDIIQLRIASRFLDIMQQLCETPLNDATGATLLEINTAIMQQMPPTIALTQISRAGGLLKLLNSDAFMVWSASNLVEKIHQMRQAFVSSQQLDTTCDYGHAVLNFQNKNGQYVIWITLQYLEGSTCRVYAKITEYAHRTPIQGHPPILPPHLKSFVTRSIECSETVKYEDIVETFQIVMKQALVILESQISIMNAFLLPGADVSILQPLVYTGTQLNNTDIEFYKRYYTILVDLEKSFECNLVNILFSNKFVYDSMFTDARAIKVAGCTRLPLTLAQGGGSGSGRRAKKLSLLTRVQLLALAKQHNIKGVSALRKADIIACLTMHSKFRKPKNSMTIKERNVVHGTRL